MLYFAFQPGNIEIVSSIRSCPEKKLGLSHLRHPTALDDEVPAWTELTDEGRRADTLQ